MFCCSSFLRAPALFKKSSVIPLEFQLLSRESKSISIIINLKSNYHQYFCVIEGYSIDFVYIGISYEECILDKR